MTTLSIIHDIVFHIFEKKKTKTKDKDMWGDPSTLFLFHLEISENGIGMGKWV